MHVSECECMPRWRRANVVIPCRVWAARALHLRTCHVRVLRRPSRHEELKISTSFDVDVLNALSAHVMCVCAVRVRGACAFCISVCIQHVHAVWVIARDHAVATRTAPRKR